MKEKKRKDNPTEFADKIKSLLQPTGTVAANTRPPITEYYRGSFKNVDNFNQLLGFLKYPYRIATPELAWFIHTVKMMAVQTYVL